MKRWTGTVLAVVFAGLSVMPAVAQEASIEDLNAKVRALAEEGKLEEAAGLAEQALLEAEAAFGASDPKVAPFLGLVAGVYMDQGRHSEAGTLLKRVPWMWHAVHEEAVALFRAQRYAEGLKAAEEALRFAEEFFGSEAKFAEYPPTSITPALQKIAGYTAASMNTLALIHEAEGRYDQAEVFYQRAVRLREMVFGPDHFEVVAPLANLALMYDAQGRYTEAGRLYDRLLTIYENTQSPDHPHLLKLLDKYAEVLKKTDRAEEAKTLEARAAQIRARRKPSENQELRWQRLAPKASPLVQQQQYAQAAEVAEEALQIAEALFDPADWRFFFSLDALATVYRFQGRASDAEPLYRRALAIAEQGKQYYEVASTLHSLGELYSANGQQTEAEESYQRALTVFESAFGTDHSSMAAYLHSLAKVYLAQGRYAEAKPLYERTITIYEYFGLDAPGLDSVYEEYTRVLRATGEEEQVEGLLEKRAEDLRSYAAKEASWWELNKEVQALASTGPYADIVKAAKKAFDFAEQNLAPRSPLLATSLDNMAKIYFSNVNVPFHGVYAELAYQRSLALKQKIFGPNDPPLLEAIQMYCGVFKKIMLKEAEDPMGVCTAER